MLGKPYNEGMKVVANFVPDETLKKASKLSLELLSHKSITMVR